MNAMPISLTGSPISLLRGLGHLLWLYFSWRSVVLGCALLGLAMLSLALTSWFDAYLAYSLSVAAFGLLLIVPLLAAPSMLRKLIAHRSISMVPRLALLAGIALLLLTLLASLFLPLAAMTLDMPDVTLKFGVQMFIIASAYVGLVQLLMISKYGMAGFSLLPILMITALAQFGVSFLQWFSQQQTLIVLSVVTLACWGYALLLLARRSAFRRPFVAATTDYSNSNTMQGFTRVAGLELGRGASPAGTLLLAYPASLVVRLINIGTFVLVSPFAGALLLTLGPDKLPAGLPYFFVNSFMMMSLTCGCLSCFAYGELAARARLLWLRVGGDRAQLWRLTERELWKNLGILASLLITVTALAAWVNASVNPLHYCAIVLACATYDTYRGLCARLAGWSSLTQVLVLSASLGTLAGAIAYSTTKGSINVLISAELGFVLLALMFRFMARTRFMRVDWLSIKPAVSKRAMANA